MKLDLLVFAAHPDDAELACSGTIIKHVKMGKKVGIIDLTRGEMGTRGTAETRAEESKNATKILGIHVRENLALDDCFFDLSKESQLAIIRMIRKYKPDTVLANAIDDRHPDHGRGAKLVSEAFFKAGLRKIETFDDGNLQEPWRPGAIYHYIQDRYIKPDFVIDITEEQEQKLDSIRAFKTQFFDPNSNEPQTYISSPDFLETIIARSREFGKLTKSGVFAEGFTVEKIIEVNKFEDIF
jgi:bacillithiol biosynthesis deacetylase BshB1